MSAKPTEAFILDDAVYETVLTRKFAGRKRWSPPDPSKVEAHIPGLILKVRVAAGQSVQAGTPLLVLEAMKMQNDVCAHGPAAVKAVHVKEGDLVAKGQLLVELELP
jgi:biotin carboxyl carrier protein